MKALVLALCLVACSPDPFAGEAPFVPGASDGGVQAIPSELVLDSGLVIKLRISYDLDWDGLMAYGLGSPSLGGHRQVSPVDQMVCPNIWVLVCHDEACTQVEAQFANVPASSRTMQAMDHFPHAIETKYCDYQVARDGLPYSASIQVAHGTNYVWTGMRCPNSNYSWGGNTGLQHGMITNPGTSVAVFNLGSVSGPFGDKEGWRLRANGCAEMPLNDPAWNAPFALDMHWCQGIPGQPCLPGTFHFLNATW